MSQPLRDWTGYDHVGAIIEHEGGILSDEDTVRLVQHLVDTGLAWRLQGHYGRLASNLIQRGLVAKDKNSEPEYATVEDYVEAIT